MAEQIPIPSHRKRKRRRQDKPSISARLVLDDHVKGDVGIFSEDLFADLFPAIAHGNIIHHSQLDASANPNFDSPRKWEWFRRCPRGPTCRNNPLGAIHLCRRLDMDCRPCQTLQCSCTLHRAILALLFSFTKLRRSSTTNSPLENIKSQPKWD